MLYAGLAKKVVSRQRHNDHVEVSTLGRTTGHDLPTNTPRRVQRSCERNGSGGGGCDLGDTETQTKNWAKNMESIISYGVIVLGAMFTLLLHSFVFFSAPPIACGATMGRIRCGL